MANENLIRASIVSRALAETSKGVAALQPDPADPTKRRGWERLLDYFHTAAPGVYKDANITRFHGPIPDWCGIFALWAIKASGVSWVGTWQDGKGIASVSGMIPTSSPLPGDVGAIKEAPQHMDLVYTITGKSIQTIDGNSINGGVTGPSSLKTINSFTAGFSPRTRLTSRRELARLTSTTFRQRCIRSIITWLRQLRCNPKPTSPSTAAGVLAYKRKRGIINRTYQTQPDNIVGKNDNRVTRCGRVEPKPRPLTKINCFPRGIYSSGSLRFFPLRSRSPMLLR
jgi:hypothetical protein